MATIDYIIIGLYMLTIFVVGYFIQRIARKDIDSYFLGNRKLPWWVLGASGMAANVDISGTMINTALIYGIGTYAFYIEFRGGVVLMMAFLMVLMGKWNRRSQVMTLAEWMHLRFGTGRQGNMARLLMAIASLILTIALVSYFSIASGKFAAEFLNINWKLAALIMIIIAASYCVASGLYAIVWVDVIQGFLILLVTVFVCAKALALPAMSGEIQTSVPLLGGGFETITTTYEKWTSFLPPAKLDMPGHYAIFNLFGVAVMIYLIRVIMEGFGGGNSYMAQRFFATSSDKEAGLTSLFWIVLLMFRWPLTAALALLGIYYGMNHEIIADPENVLPVVVNHFIPVGVKGLVIAGFMAAAMSTLNATVNAGASYWVKDIFQAFINPKASDKTLMWHSRITTMLILGVGLLFSFTIQNVNEIWGWATMGIIAGIMVPQLLRWYWWRFNGYGFAIGTFAGTLSAILIKLFFRFIPEYYLFVIASLGSLAGCIIGTYMFPPTDDKALETFYKRVRPFGWWGHIKNTIKPEVRSRIKKENTRDIWNIVLVIPWQVTLFLSGMMVIYKQWDNFAMLFSVFAALSVALYFNWYKFLGKEVTEEEVLK